MSSLFETSSMPAIGYARVAPEKGIDITPMGLTYAIPKALAGLRVGDRVVVPLGRRDRPVSGFVTEVFGESALRTNGALPTRRRGAIKPIVSRDPQAISLTDDLVGLARWMAGYYCCPLGMVFSSMLPAAVKRGTGTITRTVVRMVTIREWGSQHPEGRCQADGQPVTDQSQNPSEADNKRVGVSPTGVPAAGLDDHGDDRDASLVVNHHAVQCDLDHLLGSVRVTPLQRAILAEVAKSTQRGEPWSEVKQLASLAGARSVAPVRKLIEKGLLITKQESTLQTDLTPTDSVPDIDRSPEAGHQLTTAQQHAVDQLIHEVDHSLAPGIGFGVHLLHGVTGSGKTEVYLRVIEHLLSRPGRPALTKPRPQVDDSEPATVVLVPEIALTPQTAARFLERFDGVAVLHSGLTATQRHEQWRRISRGQARVVVGARSGVFAPLPNVGLIIVDEEHDASYKQDQLPRYHARDVAVKRAQILGIPVILGSATPSLESYYNATIRKSYHLLRLPQRVTGLKLPKVEIIDMKTQRLHPGGAASASGGGIPLLSERLEHSLRLVLDEGGQAMLLLNRRGWANYIACPDAGCGWLMNCDYCDAMMVYHKDQQLPTGGLLRCHHCRAEQLLPSHCPVCQKRVVVFGQGTQRVEAVVAHRFPTARLLRMDSDTMRTGRDYQQGLAAFGRGEVDVLLGTQMIAKGLDFPNVRLVGVISADTALHLPDFRASERTFQLIAQVAGRAGRGEQPGRVIVQSFQPDDPAITRASRHDYEGFAQRELQVRHDSGLPPYSRMARIVVRNLDPAAADQQAKVLVDHLRQHNQVLGNRVEIVGPMPCPIARIADYHRRQIELIASSDPQASGTPSSAGAGAILQKLLTALRNQRVLISDAHTAVDVDPVMLS